MEIKYAAISRTGKRSDNEDSFRIWNSPDKDCWMGTVCDGLGGHAFGEVASDVVADVMTDYWIQHPEQEDDQTRVIEACRKSSGELDRKAHEMGCRNMGTTMVMASIRGHIATIAHIGDSRCYLVRPSEKKDEKEYGLLYRTKDHVRSDFGWEVITHCFFSCQSERAVPEIRQFEVMPGDRLLLCSDGVYKGIASEILAGLLADDKSPQEMIDVIDILCEKNSNDNYTAVLAIIKE